MAKEKKIKVVMKESGKAPVVAEISNTLKTLQGAVGGYIEVVQIPEDSWYDVSYESEPEFGMDIICNDEGKLLGLDPNVRLGAWAFSARGGFVSQRVYDIVCGTIIIASADEEGNFASLSKDQIQAALDWIHAWQY